MSTTSVPVTTTPPVAPPVAGAAAKAKTKLTSPWASLVAIVIALLWTIPTFGLAVTSIRPEDDIRTSGWWAFFTDPQISFKNYETVLAAKGASAMGNFVVNSFIIVIPSVIIPVVLATLAAYVFAWVKFPGRDVLFIVVFALQIVPIQVTLLPLLKLYVKVDLAGTYWAVWLSHSTFALPLAIFLLHNFMKEIPPGLLEAARVDGAGHVSIFTRVLLPLLTPALAAFGIFQFLWVWNDLLVALTFAGNELAPMTLALANLSGSRDQAWHLLSAGSFVAIIVPVIVFLSLQRYFVRGLLAGGLKG